VSKALITVSLLTLLALGVSLSVVIAPGASAKIGCPGNSCHNATATTATSTSETTTTVTTTAATTTAATTTAATTTAATTTAATTTAATTTSPVSTTTTSTSASHIYWGAYMDGNDTYDHLYGGSWGDAPWDSVTAAKFASNAGKTPSIVHWGLGTPWAHDFAYWQGTFNLVQNAGSLSLADMSTGSVPLRDITAGGYDSYLRTWATQAKAWGHPFFLRPDWEMNGGWFPWGTTSANQNTPAEYVAAWRHMYDIFSSAGATNVTWVWCPNLEYNGSVPFSQLYPGDAYVDWTCLDGYNKGSSSVGFASLFGQSYTDLVKLAPSKPVMIGETSSFEYSGAKAAWITDALGTQLPQRFPQVKAFVWFNWRIAENGGWSDWEIESSASSQAAFKSAIGSSYYLGGGGLANLPLLSKIQPS
jgi:beta-mannanase